MDTRLYTGAGKLSKNTFSGLHSLGGTSRLISGSTKKIIPYGHPSVYRCRKIVYFDRFRDQAALKRSLLWLFCPNFAPYVYGEVCGRWAGRGESKSV